MNEEGLAIDWATSLGKSNEVYGIMAVDPGRTAQNITFAPGSDDWNVREARSDIIEAQDDTIKRYERQLAAQGKALQRIQALVGYAQVNRDMVHHMAEEIKREIERARQIQ